MPFLLYGANGYTGSLVTRTCVQRGLRPVLAGRSEAKVRALAERYGLDYRIADLNDSAAVNRMVHDMPVVLHCAGPYAATSRPMANACLQTGVHYLDLAGEIPVYRALQERDAEARRAGVMLLPGVGFDIVPTDCMAALLKQRLPSATALRLGVHGVGRLSQGTMNTVIELMDFGGMVRKYGALTPVPPGWKTRDIDFGVAATTASTLPLADVFTAYYSTGIADIEAYVALPAVARFALRSSRFVRPLLGAAPLRRALKRLASLLPEGPDDDMRAQWTSHVWGEVNDGNGTTVGALLHGPNIYTLTALTAVAAVERVLEGGAVPGFQTPSLALGAEFITTIDGVRFEMRS